jgi:site-specific DNA-cytosine methylase
MIGRTRTIGCLAGGGGCGAYGAILAGYSPAWSIDNSEAANRHYRQNLARVAHTIDILNAEPSDYPPTDGMIGSPSCCNYSDANVDGGEKQLDIDISRAMGRWIYTQRPAFALIENVYAYAGSDAWLALQNEVTEGPYQISTFKASAVKFGISQTRRRFYAMIFNPNRVSYSPPTITHGQKLLPYTGWGEAFMGQRSILVGLESDELNECMIKPLAMANTLKPCLISRVGYRKMPSVWPLDVPMGTIRASLADDGKSGRSKYLTLWVPDPVRGDPLVGKAYNITTPALAALMGLPRWQWSGNNTDDVRIIGNGIIPRMAQIILNQIKW